MAGQQDYMYSEFLSDCERKIVTELVPYDVLEDPLMKEIIREGVILKNIKEQPTSTTKNQMIFQHVYDGGDPAYQKFKEILNNTKHLKLLAYLHQKEMGVPDDEADLWQLIVDETLRRCRQGIIEDLYPSDVLDRFLQGGFITQIRYRDIVELQTSTIKNENIYAEVDKQGITGYIEFKQVLQDTKATGVYASLVQEERNISNELVLAKDILEDYIHYRNQKAGIEGEISHRHTSNSQIPLIQKMRQICTDFEVRYKSEFSKEMDQGSAKELVTESDYLSALQEMFSDRVHWGRIVGLVSFCGALSVSSLRQEDFGHDTVLECTLEYITQNLDRWIKDNGGWTALLDFPKHPDDEDDADGLMYRDAYPSKKDRTSVHGNGDWTQTISVKQFLWVASAFFLGVAVSRK